MTNPRFRVYLAASSAPEEIARAGRCAVKLLAAGVDVVSTWPTVIGQVGAANPRIAGAERRLWSAQDLHEVGMADALWLLCPPPGAATRGAWVELGAAYARGKIIVSSGDTKQSIFTALGLEYDSDDEALHGLLLVARRP